MPPNGQTTDSTDSEMSVPNFGNFRFGWMKTWMTRLENMSKRPCFSELWALTSLFAKAVSPSFLLAIVCVCSMTKSWSQRWLPDTFSVNFSQRLRFNLHGIHTRCLIRTAPQSLGKITSSLRCKKFPFFGVFWEQNNKQIPWQPT